MIALKATFIIGCLVVGTPFVCWILWAVFWDLYDHLMQQRKRRSNAHFDARVGRDCYRDNYREWTR